MLVSPAIAWADVDDTHEVRPVVTTQGWQLGLVGYLQVDAILADKSSQDELDPATRAPLNKERIYIPRGQLRVEAHRGDVFSVIEYDGNTQNGAVGRVVGAWLGWQRGSLIRLRLGLLQLPFGAEVPARVQDKPFLEAPTVTRALFPGLYDGGAIANGAYGVARWAVGITNGAMSGDAQWKGVDPTHSYDFVGRVGADVAGPYHSRFVAGVSALSGTGLSPGTPPTKDRIVWVDDNLDGQIETSELRDVAGSPGTPSQTFHRNGLGADLAVHWCVCALGKGVAFAEVVAGNNLDRSIVFADPVEQGLRDIRELGWFVGAVQEITPYARVGVRYDRYEGDRDAAKQAGIDQVSTHQRYTTLGFLLTGMWHDARLTLAYDRNHNPLGLDVSGFPATRTNDRVTLRAQVAF